MENVFRDPSFKKICLRHWFPPPWRSQLRVIVIWKRCPSRWSWRRTASLTDIGWLLGCYPSRDPTSDRILWPLVFIMFVMMRAFYLNKKWHVSTLSVFLSRSIEQFGENKIWRVCCSHISITSLLWLDDNVYHSINAPYELVEATQAHRVREKCHFLS